MLYMYKSASDECFVLRDIGARIRAGTVTTGVTLATLGIESRLVSRREVTGDQFGILVKGIRPRTYTFYLHHGC